MGCAGEVFDGTSYGAFSGFVIGSFMGALYGTIVKSPRLLPHMFEFGMNNAIFGATLFGVLTAYRRCF